MSNCNLTKCNSAHDEVRELRIILINKDKDLGAKLSSYLQAGGVTSIQSVIELKTLNKSLDTLNPDIIFIHPDGFNKSSSEIIELVKQIDENSDIVIIEGNTKTEPTHLIFGTVSYLDKPLNFRKVEKVISGFLLRRKIEHFETIMYRLNSAVCPVKLKFSTRQGHIFIDPEEIIYFKADSNYTHIFLRDRKQITVAKSLRTFDVGLSNSFFERISRSAIVNLNYLIELDRHQKMCLLRYKDQEYKLPVTKTHIKSLFKNYLNC